MTHYDDVTLEQAAELRRRERPRASTATIVLLVLILVVLVATAVTVILILLSIRTEVHNWGIVLDGLFGYSPGA